MTYSTRQMLAPCRLLVCMMACLLFVTGCAAKEQVIEPLEVRADVPDTPYGTKDFRPDIFAQKNTPDSVPSLVSDDGKVRVISPYGPRKSGKRTRAHRGVDIKAPKGAAVLAYKSGEVVVSGRRRGYGLSVDVRHADGSISRYAHMSKISVKTGERVYTGDAVGAVGQTGRATTAHLHFEVLRNGKAVNPMPYLNEGLSMVVRNDAASRKIADAGTVPPGSSSPKASKRSKSSKSKKRTPSKRR